LKKSGTASVNTSLSMPTHPSQIINKNNVSKILLQDTNSPKLAIGNKAMKFDQYGERKDIYLKKDAIDKVTYLEPYDYLSSNKGVDFDRMKQRNINDLLPRNLGPSICYYEPNYDFVKKRSPQILRFSQEGNRVKKANKQYLIKKMWNSYDVVSDYKIVKLKSFVELNKK
jgi:hypothetical protein